MTTDASRRIYLGADHGGYALKQHLVAHLTEQGHTVVDLGAHGPDAVDFSDFAYLVAQAVAADRGQGQGSVGVMIDSIGQASSIVANKVRGIRAVPGYEPFAVKSSRVHNDANVLCLGGQMLGNGLARNLVDLWLETPFGGGRHQRRLDKVIRIDEERSGKG